MLGKSSSSERFADFFERKNRRIILKKEIASFFGRVYWFAPFGALASCGCRLMTFTLEDQKRDFLPYREGDASAPGCLTSKDEERETWTAESLRVSIARKLRLSRG